MPKGKEALASAQRRERNAHSLLLDREAQLRDAKETIVSLNRQVIDQAGLISEIERLRTQARLGTSDEVVAVRAANDHLRQQLAEIRVDQQRMQELWDRFIKKAVQRLGGGWDGFEELAELISGLDHRIVIAENDAQRKLPTQAIKRIQAARGIRRSLTRSAKTAENATRDKESTHVATTDSND